MHNEQIEDEERIPEKFADNLTHKIQDAQATRSILDVTLAPLIKTLGLILGLISMGIGHLNRKKRDDNESDGTMG